MRKTLEEFMRLGFWDVLACAPGSSKRAIKLAYQKLARVYHPDQGGDSSAVAAFLTHGVCQVHATEKAFAAIKAAGNVVTWVSSTFGGDSTAVAGGVGVCEAARYRHDEPPYTFTGRSAWRGGGRERDRERDG